MTGTTDPSSTSNGVWGPGLGALEEWDPTWASACRTMANTPWTDGVLPRKFVELIGVAINVACTNLNADGTRRHIRQALDGGATRDEILLVIKCATVMAIHSCSLGAPVLIEEAKEAGAELEPSAGAPTPACDAMKAIGQWNVAWDPFLALDPAWTDAFMATGGAIYRSAVLSPKEIELISIAFDASFTHMYAPGTRRHIHNALKAGATPREIFAVLQICAAQGVAACHLGVPILAEELARRDDPGSPPAASASKVGP